LATGDKYNHLRVFPAGALLLLKLRVATSDDTRSVGINRCWYSNEENAIYEFIVGYSE